MWNLIISLVIAGINVAAIIYLLFRSRKFDIDAIIDKVRQSDLIDDSMQKLVGYTVGAAQQLWSDGGQEYIEGFTSVMTDEILDRLKKSVLGTAGGLASGAVRQESMLLKAASEDIMETQVPWLGAAKKIFPRAFALIDDNPELLKYVPDLIERFKKYVPGLQGDGSKPNTGVDYT